MRGIYTTTAKMVCHVAPEDRDLARRAILATAQDQYIENFTSQTAERLENAVHAKHPGDTPRSYHRYKILSEDLRYRMCVLEGEFLETCVASQIASGAITPEEAIAKIIRNGPPTGKVDPRTEIRAMFYSLIKDDVPDVEKRREIAVGMDRGCYNYAISRCLHQSVIPQWDVPQFTELYGSRCGEVAASIDKNSCVKLSTVSVHELPYALKQIVDGNWNPDFVGALTADELSPTSHSEIKELIRKRQGTKIEQRRSNLFECPRCHARDCMWRLIQGRALDEPATAHCRCNNCGTKFVEN
jgi:DNA-directed RNA polymerase subunit M/transcription elongation factor TFIIS